MRMHAQIIYDQKKTPLNNCSQVFLVLITIMLQLKICLNNFCNEATWILVMHVQIHLQVLDPNNPKIVAFSSMTVACELGVSDHFYISEKP